MYSLGLQFLCPTFIVRKDVDVGSSVIGNRHRKNEYMQIRLGEVVDTIVILKNTQLNLIYCGFGLDELLMILHHMC